MDVGELKFFKFIDNEKYVFVGRDGVLMILGEKSTGMEAFSDQWDPHKLGDAVNAWVVHGKAFAEKEWQSADGSWVNATSAAIPAGGSLTRGFRIILAEGGVQQKSKAGQSQIA